MLAEEVLVFLMDALVLPSLLAGAAAEEALVRLEGQVLDAASSKPLEARLYIRREDGQWFTASSAAKGGAAIPYDKRNGDSVEVHTTLSAHPFLAELPAGEYTITAERGKEYFPAEQRVTLGREQREPVRVALELRRWIDMASRGWYSGETHIHRSLDELPALLLAEDLNVAFPLVYWVTRAFAPPSTGDRSGKADLGAKIIAADATHVIYPRNTEYEIFTVNGVRHELGAVFLLNHSSVLGDGAPPVRPIAERVHREGGLIELDKHAWPWSMALVPVMKVDLYELANNHLWRAPFAFRGWGAAAAPYMRVERDEGGWTERGWIDYGFKCYYALLDCGFRLRPTAGTASGVHPVPLGFGRVYVRLDGPFAYEAWLRGLDEGRSFVTTGPMLFAGVTEKEPGRASCRVAGSAIGPSPLARIEVVVNGEVAASPRPENAKTPEGAFESRFDLEIPLAGTSWIAVRAFEDGPSGRLRFAHTAPRFIDVEGKPLRPRREEVEFLIQRVRDQIARSSGVLPPAAIEEYKDALRAYEEIGRAAR